MSASTLRQAIRANTTPLSEADWITACAAAGLSVLHHQTGEMDLLQPQSVLRDEGVTVILEVVWTLLTCPLIRRRFCECVEYSKSLEMT